MSATVREKDYGFEKITQELEKFKGAVVKAGILSSSGENKNEVSIVQYATWNENGVMSKSGKWKIPPRPFIKMWAELNQKQTQNVLTRLYGEVAVGHITADEALNRLGKYAKSGIQHFIRTHQFKPNAPYTIKKKGSSQPLIDTGAMRDAVNFEVEK